MRPKEKTIKQQLERRQLGSHAVKTWSHLGPIQVHQRSLLGSYSHYCWMTCMKHIFLLNHCVSSGLREVSTSLNGHLLESTTVFPLILGRTCFRINSKEIVPCAVGTFESRIPRCGHNSFLTSQRYIWSEFLRSRKERKSCHIGCTLCS